jgi:polyhydroxyalkanoate synthesis regulator phasin
MIGMMRKAFYFGLGGISVTKEKAEQLVDELIKKKEVEPAEASGLVKELVEKGEQERAAAIEFIRKEVSHIRSELGLVTRTEIQEVLDRLKAIEERLDNLEPKHEADQ